MNARNNSTLERARMNGTTTPIALSTIKSGSTARGQTVPPTQYQSGHTNAKIQTTTPPTRMAPAMPSTISSDSAMWKKRLASGGTPATVRVGNDDAPGFGQSPSRSGG